MKMSSELVNWISIIGSFLSLIGVIIALVQIYKTRRAAEIAKDAVLETQKAISRNLLLSDVSICVKYIEEIRLYVRDERYELAQIRVNDLNSHFIQIQSLLKRSNQIHQIDFDEILFKLSNIRSMFEKKLTKSSVKINIAVVNSQLALISDDLNKLIGETKFAIQEDN